MAATKKCPDCEVEIGESETKCPKCGFDFETLTDEMLDQLDRAQRINAKRRAAKEEEARKEAEKNKPPVKKSILDGLRKVGKK